MKLPILTILTVLALTATVGCAQGVKTATILPPDGSTGYKSSPSTTDKGTDEIIAPKSETPPAPATPPAPTTPPETPPAPVKPGEKKPEEKKPIVLEKPIIIGYLPPYLDKPIIVPMPLPEKTVKLVATGLKASYVCENCGGSGGEAHDYMCPTNYVVTGYELGTADFGCPSGDGGCADYTIVGALRVTCAKPTPLNIDPETSDWAQDYERGGLTTAGEGSFSDLRKDQCSFWPGMGSGVATGVFGRSGDRLDSFGFFCGSYVPTKTDVTIDRSSTAKETTYQWDGYEFGGAPGVGGAPFSVSCPDNQAVVGLRIRSGSDVDGIDAIYCAGLEPVLF